MGFLIENEFPAFDFHGKTIIYIPQIKAFIKYHINSNILSKLQNIIKTYSKRNAAKSNKRLIIIPTFECNLSCNYCFLKTKANNNPSCDGDTLIRIIANKVNDDNFNIIHLYGGEPTIESDFILNMINLLKNNQNKGLSLSLYISTNGLYSLELARYLGDNKITLFISTDGHLFRHNQHRFDNPSNHNALMNNIKYHIKTNSPLKIRITVTRYNVDDLPEIAISFFKMGVQYIHFEPEFNIFRQTGWESFLREYIDAMLKISTIAENYSSKILDSTILYLLGVDESHCLINGENEVYTPDGFISKCYRFPNGFTNKEDTELFKVGYYNCNQGAVIFKDKVSKLMNAFLLSKRGCSECFAKFLCSGGCIAQNLNFNGDVSTHDAKTCDARRYLTDNYLKALFSKSYNGGLAI